MPKDTAVSSTKTANPPIISQGSMSSGAVSSENEKVREVAPEKNRKATEILELANYEAYLTQIGALSSKDYSHELASLLRKPYPTAEDLERMADFLRVIDGEKALETYFEYKKMYGISIGQNVNELRSLLTQAGEMDGARLVDRILSESPEGMAEFGSFVHGWAKANPEQVLDWWLDMPSDDPMYEQSLGGLFWGLVEYDPEYAFETFSALNLDALKPEDRSIAGTNVAGALLRAYGTDGMEEWVRTLPKDLQARSVEWSLRWLGDYSAEEVVPWLSDHAGDSSSINQVMNWRAEQWARSDPAAALEWANNYAYEGPAEQSRQTFENIARTVDNQSLSNWYFGNPQHPYSSIARDILFPPGGTPSR